MNSNTQEPSCSHEIFARTELLIGSNALQKLHQTKVIIFGVGGVGSWCAESLIRSGIGHLTMVDFDTICASNVNRQLMATTRTIGLSKVDVMRQRLLDINPEADITALKQLYTPETAESFHLETYDVIIDAIDSLDNKAHLIRHACTTRAVFVSSMGAALKMDAQKIAIAEFWKVRGCPLAAALRRKFKKSGLMPTRKFKCVYSEELLRNQEVEQPAESTDNALPFHKAQTNGTIAHTTAIFGFHLAGLVIQLSMER